MHEFVYDRYSKIALLRSNAGVANSSICRSKTPESVVNNLLRKGEQEYV